MFDLPGPLPRNSETREDPVSNANKGLVLLYVGQGKGMTAAALGQMFRSLGRGFAVCCLRFTPASQQNGAYVPAELAGDRLEIHAVGKGYSWAPEDRDADGELARAAWDFAREKISSGKFDLVILDEIMETVDRGLLSEREIVRGLTQRPERVNVIITGRHAPAALIAVADLVTQVREERNG